MLIPQSVPLEITPFSACPTPAPERTYFPPGPQVGTLYVTTAAGGWHRQPVDARHVADARAVGIPVLDSIHAFEAHRPAQYPKGVVVLDGVPKWEPGVMLANAFPTAARELVERAQREGRARSGDVFVTHAHDDFDITVDCRTHRCFSTDDALRLLGQVLR